MLDIKILGSIIALEIFLSGPNIKFYTNTCIFKLCIFQKVSGLIETNSWLFSKVDFFQKGKKNNIFIVAVHFIKI